MHTLRKAGLSFWLSRALVPWGDVAGDSPSADNCGFLADVYFNLMQHVSITPCTGTRKVCRAARLLHGTSDLKAH